MKCPACHTELPDGANFCHKCGHELKSAPTAAKPRPVPEPERKQITALFSDLSGYTAMAGRLDPEDVKEITGRIFDDVRGVVSKYDGFIERFAGDGVLALFGVPTAHEDDPIRAIRAAREIHELVEALNPLYEARVGAPLSMHSGINTGLAVTADVDPEKGTHGVTGDAINIAARLSDLANAREIYVGPETYRRAEGHFFFETLEPTMVKGKSEPVSIFKVLAPKEQPVTVHGLSGLRAELTGRNAELARLREAAERLKERKGSVIAVCGDAGTGKSRLVEEFKASLDLGAIRWREGHAYAYAQNIPYFPLMDLMNRAWSIQEGDTPDQVREKIESGVERLLGTREDVAPYIGSLYSLSYPHIEEVSPEFWKSRLFGGVKRIVAALTEHAPTIFCFEDIHWADPSTLELLRFLVSDSPYPALFVCVHRLPFSLFSVDHLKTLGNQYEEIRLQDLSPSDTEAMVASLLRTDGIPGELERFIEEKVEGNPFYVEEAINSFIESGILARDNGNWRLTRPLSEAGVPSTVQGVISARLDRLEKEMKRILQEASVIGRAFLREILSRITALQDSLDQSLEGLVMRDLVRVRSLQPDLEYVFKHALTQEVVYNGLLKKERQEIHERIGLVMEQLFHDRIPEFYEALAFHFKQGRSVEKAVDYLMKSGEKSLSRCAVEESHQYYQEAFEILTEGTEYTTNTGALLIDLVTQWALVFYYYGDFKGLGDLLAAHEHLVGALDDRSRQGMFYAWKGWTLAWRENFTEGYEYLMKALNLGEEVNDRTVIGYACTWLAWICPEMGLLEEAIVHGERAEAIGKTLDRDQYVLFKSLGAMGFGHFAAGNKRKALRMADELLEIGLKHANARSTVMAYWIMAFAAFVDGDLPSAVQCSERASQSALDPFYRIFPKATEGLALAQIGQMEGARQASLAAVEFSDQFGIEWIGRVSHMVLGVVEIATGNMSQGLKMLEDDAAACLGNGRRLWYSLSQQILGNVYLQIVLGEGDLRASTILKNVGFLIKYVPFAAKKAEAHFNKAIEVAQEIGAKGILGQSYLDLGRLHKAKKRKDKARECITKAIEYFELCEAETYLKRARQELASLE